MAKRYTDTNIWIEDWFIDLPIEYKLFWYFILSNCDHAGLFRVNLRLFCSLNGVKLDSNKAIDYFNSNKERIRIISENLWLIEDFFSYQYGEIFNPNNRVHDSIEKLYNKHGIKMTSIRGLKDLKDRVKDKDKDKDKDNKYSNYLEYSKGGLGGNSQIGTKENISQLVPKNHPKRGQMAKEISEDGNYAIFEDGFMQEVGESQKLNLHHNLIKRGFIY